MFNSRSVRIFSAVIISFVVLPAQAALQGRLPVTPGGTDYQAYYDDVADLTWLADANYAKTSGYDADGLMNWGEATTWVSTLTVGGIGGWRLPNTIDVGDDGVTYLNGDFFTGVDAGYNMTVHSELSNLWYVVLGNIPFYDILGNAAQPGWGLSNTGPFSNVQSGFYWSSTEFTPSPNFVWGIFMSEGLQSANLKIANRSAWAVRSGDVGSVIPDTDQDGVDDSIDNCTVVANPLQEDSDADGHGNICDADFDNNCLVNGVDLGILKNAFFGNDPNVDMNSSGLVNGEDLGLFKAAFFAVPGPSAAGALCP